MYFNSSFSGNSRGGFAPRRGRGSRGGRGGWNAKPREVYKPDVQKHPLGDLLQTIHTSDLKSKDASISPKTAITDCQYVASYNWLSTANPTVVVPGKPPRWIPLQTPQRLKEDEGDYFRDPNAAKYPNYPMAPVVHAILDTVPSFPTSNIDLFACGSTLGNLLRFVRGMDKAFRLNIELIGNTIFFVRKEDDPREVIKDVRGFGHTFPEAYTTWEEDVRGSETHQRIIAYDFGGLKCLVRFESDGYIKDGTSEKKSKVKEQDEDDILAAFQGTAISAPPTTTSPSNNPITIKHAGTPVPQSSIFDLKTRSGKHGKEIDMSDITPLLWLKQIPNFIVAYHDGAGLFQNIKVQDVKSDVQKWEADNTDAIRRLAVLLDKIIEITKADPRGLLEAYFSGEGGLQIRSQFRDGTHALPVELREMWVAGQDDEEEDEDEDDRYKDWDKRKPFSGYDHEAYDSDNERGGYADSDSEPDYTACSAEDCGYCGKCTY